MSKAWERQPDESSQAFEAFSKYLAMGADRSIVKVAQECDKNRSLIGRWSSDWDWQNRILAYDNWLVAEEDKSVLESMRKRFNRFAQISDLAVQKATEGLMARSSDTMTNSDIRGFIQLGMMLADKHREFITPKNEEETVGDIQEAFIKALMEDEIDYDRLG